MDNTRQITNRAAVNNVGWREPDLAVVRNGRVFVLDVYDDNDTNASVARKVETVVANAAGCNIVGMALVAKGVRTPFAGKSDKLARLVTTFRRLFGGPAEGESDADVVGFLRILFEAEYYWRKHGDVRWDGGAATQRGRRGLGGDAVPARRDGTGERATRGRRTRGKRVDRGVVTIGRKELRS